MRLNLINAVMPHYCCSCGAIGEILCSYCKYDIISECAIECIACERLVARYGDTCKQCKLPYRRGWVVGRHRDSLRELIGRYKFEGTRAVGGVLGTMLNESLPELPNDAIITSVPTAPPHIRERGYDHAALIAKEFACARQLPYSPTLKRLHTMRQRGASRTERLKQAATAFAAVRPINGGRYLLIDDVCTTGATLRYAAHALRQAGADEVWVAVITKEPLD